MKIRKYGLKDYHEMPWKNGGGSTTELAIFPEGASLDHFSWRLSLAKVNVDGPFSHFAHIDRTLAVVSGKGLMLNHQGKSVVLDQASQPYSFSGEIAIDAQLCDGAVIDLNLMTRRTICQHFMQKVIFNGVEEHLVQASDAKQVLLYCAHGLALVQGEYVLKVGDLLLFEEELPRKGIELTIHLNQHTTVYLMRISFH